MYAQVLPKLDVPSLDHTFTYGIPSNLETSVKLGTCVIVPFGKGNRKVEGYVLDIVDTIDSKLQVKDIQGIKENQVFPDEHMLKLAQAIKNYYFIPYGSALKLMFLTVGNYKKDYDTLKATLTPAGVVNLESMRKSKKREFLESLLDGDQPLNLWVDIKISKATIRTLEKDALIELSPIENSKESHLKELNEAQLEVYQPIKKALEAQCPERFLLFGVTGSGKTEVYFKAIDKALSLGQQVLVLLPEINLTEQMINRFEEAFPNNVAKWHSQMSQGEKKRTIEALERKETNILIGPRSAVFVSLNNLGLIIVDEEHDGSYYQQTMPVYHGRTVALMRGEIEGATVLLGSGTPSVESYYAGLTGAYKLLYLKEKYFGQSVPDIELVDMAQELKNGNFSIFSEPLKKAMGKVLEDNKQVLLFLNRRGYYNFVLCRDCGFVMKCEDCDIALSYHHGKKKMICHYCGKEKDYPRSCPECHSKRIRGIGLGTEQVVNLVQELFPNKKVCRLDGDLLGGKHKKQAVLESFKKGEQDIIVGTQLIAKGIDFPNVALVGILLGDISLNFPDFRSREWTFQMLLQVIGRTGRRKEKGSVFLQTYRPFDIIFKKIVAHDFQGFYESELAFREKYHYPPFRELFRLQILGENETEVIKMAWELYDQCISFFGKDEIYRPKANSLKKARKKFGWQLVFKVERDSQRLKEVEGFFHQFLEEIYKRKQSQLLIYMERNPRGML